MIKAAVISDTHIPITAHELPSALIDQLKNVDMIIHAGDMMELYVLEILKDIAPTEAVAGNMDSFKLKKLLPEKKILTLGKFRVGIIHGDGPPHNILNYVMRKFEGENLDCVIYGHSHMPKIDIIANTIYFNPGSPTDKIFAPYNSFGTLEIDKKITPKIIRL